MIDLKMAKDEAQKTKDESKTFVFRPSSAPQERP
jgi:hypothetical protein